MTRTSLTRSQYSAWLKGFKATLGRAVTRPTLAVMTMLAVVLTLLTVAEIHSYWDRYEISESFLNASLRLTAFIMVLWFSCVITYVVFDQLYLRSTSFLLKAARGFIANRFYVPKALDTELDYKSGQRFARWWTPLVWIFMGSLGLSILIAKMNSRFPLTTVVTTIFISVLFLVGFLRSWALVRSAESAQSDRKRSISHHVRAYVFRGHVQMVLVVASMICWMWIVFGLFLLYNRTVYSPMWDRLVAYPHSAFDQLAQLGVVDQQSTLQGSISSSLSDLKSWIFPASFLSLLAYVAGAASPVGIPFSRSALFRIAVQLVVELAASFAGAVLLQWAFVLPDSIAFRLSVAVAIWLSLRLLWITVRLGK